MSWSAIGGANRTLRGFFLAWDAKWRGPLRAFILFNVASNLYNYNLLESQFWIYSKIALFATAYKCFTAICMVRIFDTERQITPSEWCCRCRACAFDSGCCAIQKRVERKGWEKERGKESKRERGGKKNQYKNILAQSLRNKERWYVYT